MRLAMLKRRLEGGNTLTRMIDLTLDIYDGMPTFPTHWHPRVEVTILGRHRVEGRATRKLVLGTHTGTHMDAPLHFIEGGQSIDEIPLETIVGEAAVVDLTDKGALATITAQDLEARGSAVQKGGIVILRTDWWKRWETRAFYFEHPHLTRDACQWLLDHQVQTVATDIPDIENPAEELPPGTPGPLHVLLMSEGVILVENLTNLDRLTREHVFLIALPLKIRGSEGSPARVIALEED